MTLSRWCSAPALVLFAAHAGTLASACTRRQPVPALPSDAGPRGTDGSHADAPVRDAPTSFDCDPIETGIFLTGNEISADGTLLGRTLSSYDPATNTLTELADVGSCVQSWYIRSMAVSRDGVVYFLLGNQTLAAYRLEDGTCDVRPLPRSPDDDGLYGLLTFVGDSTGSTSVFDERLNVTFHPWGMSDRRELLLELDRTTLAEIERTQITLDGAILISLAGTEDGRLFAARGNVVAGVDEHDIVRVDPIDGSMTVVATTPPRDAIWLRTAVALWDSRVFVFDAFAPDPTLRTTISEANLRDRRWAEPLLTLEDYELQAVATTSCVSVVLF